MPESSGTCSNSDIVFLVTEIGLKNLPSVIFISFAVVNFMKIRPLGFTRMYKFSLLFKSKLYVSFLLSFVNIAHVAVCFGIYCQHCHYSDPKKADTMLSDQVFLRCFDGKKYAPSSRCEDFQSTYLFVIIARSLL
jgi:hypothetical protein